MRSAKRPQASSISDLSVSISNGSISAGTADGYCANQNLSILATPLVDLLVAGPTGCQPLARPHAALVQVWARHYPATTAVPLRSDGCRQIASAPDRAPRDRAETAPMRACAPAPARY